MFSDSQRILVVAILLTFLLWTIESFFLVKLSGNAKRGFKIWSMPLSNTTLDLLKKLDNPANYVIEPFRSRGSVFYSFIIVRDDEAIISPAPHLFFPFVGYVNFTRTPANLEYRGGISHFFVFLIAFAYAAYLVIPFFALILAINYWIEILSINNYLNKKIRARRVGRALKNHHTNQ